MAGREIEFLNSLVKAETSFVKKTIVLEHIGLADPTLTKAIKYGLGYRVTARRYCVDDAVGFARDLIRKGTVTKRECWSLAQKLTVTRESERLGHWSARVSCDLFVMALSASFAANIDISGIVMSAPLRQSHIKLIFFVWSLPSI
jgi:hypothetical protein